MPITLVPPVCFSIHISSRPPPQRHFQLASFAEGAVDGLVKDAGRLDGHDGVGQSLSLAGLGDVLRHDTQSARGMLNRDRFDDDLAIKVTEHPFRPAFGAVDGDNASHSFHLSANLNARFGHYSLVNTDEFLTEVVRLIA